MKGKILTAGAIIILLVILSGSFSDFHPERDSVEINDGLLKATVAATLEERVKGLSGRADLEKDEALLMVFEESGFHSIWMKEMNFSIDIIWLDKEKRVVDFKKNVDPETYPETFSPSFPARYVLETEAGFVEKNDISVGYHFEFDL